MNKNEINFSKKIIIGTFAAIILAMFSLVMIRENKVFAKGIFKEDIYYKYTFKNDDEIVKEIKVKEGELPKLSEIPEFKHFEKEGMIPAGWSDIERASNDTEIRLHYDSQIHLGGDKFLSYEEWLESGKDYGSTEIKIVESKWKEDDGVDIKVVKTETIENYSYIDYSFIEDLTPYRYSDDPELAENYEYKLKWITPFTPPHRDEEINISDKYYSDVETVLKEGRDTPVSNFFNDQSKMHKEKGYKAIPVQTGQKVFDVDLNIDEETMSFDFKLKLLDEEILNKIKTGKEILFEYSMMGLRSEKILLSEYTDFSFDYMQFGGDMEEGLIFKEEDLKTFLELESTYANLPEETFLESQFSTDFNIYENDEKIRSVAYIVDLFQEVEEYNYFSNNGEIKTADFSESFIHPEIELESFENLTHRFKNAVIKDEYLNITRQENSFEIEELPKYLIQFVDGFGNIISSQEVTEGKLPELPENILHPENSDKFKFVGWDSEIEKVYEEKTYTAQFEINKFTVEFYDDEGKLIETQEVDYGDNAKEPNKNLDKKDRWFISWDSNLDNITENKTITAVYEMKKVFTINFRNIDGSIIQTLTLYEGDKITAPRNIKHPENDAKYKFIGWDQKVDATANKDVEYIAEFEINKFTVKFLDLKGKTISTQVIEYGGSAVYPDFQQETIDKILTGWEGDITNITSNQSFKATFELKELFFITFKNIDGSIIEVLELYKGQPIKAPIAKFISDNELFEYVFKSWDKELDELAERDIEYTAQYELTKRFKVTFKNNDGSIISEEIYLEGDTVTAPKNIEHPENAEKYKFIGWDINIEAATEDTTYTAVFEINKFTVKFLDLKGKAISTQVIEYGGSAVYPDFNQETIDKVLTGWEGDINNITSNQSFKATFEVKELFFITFKNIDGSIIEVLELYKGQPIKAPIAKFISDNELKEYIFKGWNEEVDEFAERNVEYVAEYDIVNKYRITFENVDGTIISEELYVEGGRVNDPKGVVHPDNSDKFKFIGWDSQITNATENKTYIAKYDINKFTVSFYDNDNKLIERQTVLYGENATHPEKDLDKFDRIFIEWDSDLENITSNIIVNAIYEMKELYNYTFLDYDKTIFANLKFYEGQELIVPTPSYKSEQNSFDFIFSHWTPELQKFATGDATYEAVYDVIEKYKIVFKDINGETVSEQLVLKGELPEAPLLPHPTENHKFVQSGWNEKVVPANSDQIYEVRYKIRTFNVDFFFPHIEQRISRQVVEYGSDAVAPNTDQERYTFIEWDADFTNVTQNIRVTGIFEENDHVLINFFDIEGNLIHSIKNYGDITSIDLQRKYSTLFSQPLHKFGFDISKIYELIITDETEEEITYNFGSDLIIETYREYNFILEYKEREIHEVTIVMHDGTEVIENVYNGYFPKKNIPNVPDYKFYGFIHNGKFLNEELVIGGHIGLRIYQNETITLFYTDNSGFYKEIELGKNYEIHDIPTYRTWLFKDLFFEAGNYHFIFKSGNETRIVNIVISDNNISMMVASIAPTRQRLLLGSGYFIVNSQTTIGDQVTVKDINSDYEFLTFFSTRNGQFSLNEGHKEFEEIDEIPIIPLPEKPKSEREFKLTLTNAIILIFGISTIVFVYKLIRKPKHRGRR